jgi:hypothetical protein
VEKAVTRASEAFIARILLNGVHTVVSCHLNYHTEMFFETTSSATECSVDSELTEE